MRHAFFYHGAFETNFPTLRTNSSTFKSTDGKDVELPAPPSDVDGARVGYMEKPGKHFFGVRVTDRNADVVLENPVFIEPEQHMGVGKRFGAQPTVVGDEPMLVFLQEAAAKNPAQSHALHAVINRIRHG